MNKKSHSCLLFFLLTISPLLFCQEENAIFYVSDEKEGKDSNAIYLSVSSLAFFKNNEYFGHFVDGYTLPGYCLSPELLYVAGTSTYMRAGIYYMQFAGLVRPYAIRPLFRIRHDISSFLDIIAGSLEGGLNHRLSEPLYGFDNYFFRQPEYGLQLLLHTAHISSDLWCNWRQFILWGDDFQEEFTVGNYSMLRLSDTAAAFRLSFPFQTLITHKGGQINNTDAKIESIFNLSPGLIAEHYSTATKIKRTGLFAAFCYYFNPFDSRAYHEGYAIYPQCYISTSMLDCRLGYWRAHNFFAPEGEALFSSVSSVHQRYNKRNRELVTTKISLSKYYRSGMRFGFRLETYYDIATHKLDYSTGLFLLFNKDFFLTAVP